MIVIAALPVLLVGFLPGMALPAEIASRARRSLPGRAEVVALIEPWAPAGNPYAGYRCVGVAVGHGSWRQWPTPHERPPAPWRMVRRWGEE